MEDFDLNKAWEKASPELKKLGKETFFEAKDLALSFFATGFMPEVPTGDDLDAALRRAEVLSKKLEGEIAKRKAAGELVRAVLTKAVEIVVNAAITGVKR